MSLAGCDAARVVTQTTVAKVLIHRRDEHTYAFIFNDKTRNEALRKMGRFAADPKLNFTWYDAAVASKKARHL